jgi:hypothetical protein
MTVRDNNNKVVAFCADTHHLSLIAAAPDLLEALQYVLAAHGEQLDHAFQMAQDAVTKAIGEQT